MSLYTPPGASGPRQSSSPFELRHASTHRPLLVVVPERRMLAIDGAGRREAGDFRLATDLLRTAAGVVRAMARRARGAEPLRSVLEITWSLEPGLTADAIVELLSGPRPRWRQMMEVPAGASEAMAVEAIDETRRRGGREMSLVRLIHLTEGPAVQILHLGRDDALSSIRKLFAFVAESGLQADGDLHELVLADPAIVGELRGRSILRVPIAAD